MRQKLLPLLAAVGLVLSSSWASAKTVEYSFKVLPSLGNGYLNAPVLGGNNWVAGTSVNPDGSTVATVWKQGTPVAYNVTGADFTRAVGLNDQGDVVGYASMAGQWQAVLWHGKKTKVLPPLAGQASAVAVAINASGQVAGFSGSNAVVWRDDSVLDLGLYGSPYAINAVGTVVGLTQGGVSVRAAKWQEGLLTRLDFLPAGALSWATNVNDAGLIVGCSAEDGSSPLFPVQWLQDGTVLRLSGIGNGDGCANGVNSAGVIVGKSGGVATRWKDGAAVDLNLVLPKSVADAGWRLTEANSINDTGRIVGKASNSLTGELVFFLLTPKK